MYMLSYVKKMLSLKGIIIFILLVLFSSSAGYLKTSYLNYTGISQITASLDLGIVSIRYSFILAMTIALVLAVLYQLTSFNNLANGLFGTLLS